MIPRTVPIVCGKSRQKRGASIAVRQLDPLGYRPRLTEWRCASCGQLIRNVVWG